jgi:hypothetical protein
MVALIEKIIANLLVFGAFIVLGVIAIAGSIYSPVLGFLHCLLLAAYFFDYNKKRLGRFFISPNLFMKKTKLVTNDHRLLFFICFIAWVINLLMILIRVFD